MRISEDITFQTFELAHGKSREKGGENGGSLYISGDVTQVDASYSPCHVLDS